MVNEDKTEYFYIYRITNIITGKYYLGMHTTSNLDDDYYGSGKIIKRSIRKYGKENHKKEILEFLETYEDLIWREREIVNENVINDPLSMNIRIGGVGGGGWTIEQQRENNRKSQISQKDLNKISNWREQKSRRMSETNRDLYKTGKRKVTVKPHKVGEFKHTEESKRRIANITSKAQSGKGNSQYGTVWIHNISLRKNKKIKKDQLQTWAEQGWVAGRKMKF